MDNITMQQRVQAQFEALLLEPILKPLESAFGQYGSIAEDTFAEILSRELPS